MNNILYLNIGSVTLLSRKVDETILHLMILFLFYYSFNFQGLVEGLS